MRTRLVDLRNQKVREAIESEDGLHLLFESGVSLSIFNTVSRSGPAEEKLTAINDRRIVHVQEQEESATLSFDNGSILRVDLRDTAFNGPEAMVMRTPGKPIIVWN